MSENDTDHPHGAFLWSGMRPEADFPIWERIALLPFYLGLHGYHCLRGTPVYVQYGNHEHRYEDTGSEQPDDDLRADGGSKYVVPTGDGYLGVWRTKSYFANVAIGAINWVDWLSDIDVYAVEVDQDHAIGIVEDPGEHDVICELPVKRNHVGTDVHVQRPVLEALDGFEPGVDVRAYRRDAGGMYLVPAPQDPFVDGGDGS